MKTGRFELTISSIPAQAQMDGVIRLSSGPASRFDDLAVAVRYFTDGLRPNAVDAKEAAR